MAGLVIVAVLSGCQTVPRAPEAPPPPAAPEEAPAAALGPPPPPPRFDQPDYFRLRNTSADTTPVRIAILLPLSNPSAETRAIALALQRAAELALFDSGNANIILMPRDDAGSPERAVAAARQALDDGAEIILGPLFAQSAEAVGPIARERGVPVIAFSSDRSAGGDGVYLLSFQPETEVQRIVSYAARSGHNAFAALVPQTAYGDIVAAAFRESVSAAGGAITAVQPFESQPAAVARPAAGVARSYPDAILVADGGVMLRALAPALALNGATPPAVRLLGTGLWDDINLVREPMLLSGWFAAPPPEAWQRFSARYRATYDAAAPRIATLAYDAVSLVALLSNGQPYRRFTDAALIDPNGFAGIDGIFRFRTDGAAERGLAVLQINPGGFTVVDPAPTSFIGVGF